MTGAVLTGFVRIEEDGDRLKPAAANGKPHHHHSQQHPAAGGARWLYCVLRHEELRLYARRTDYKRDEPPMQTVPIQMKAIAANESVFGFDQECVYVRSKATNTVLRLRIHQRKDIVRWVTALYYQSLNTKRSPKHDNQASGDAEANGASGDECRARKSVSFKDEPLVRVLPRESYDAADLFYTEHDYEQFMQREAPPNFASLMRSIYKKTTAKLKVSHRKHAH